VAANWRLVVTVLDFALLNSTVQKERKEDHKCRVKNCKQFMSVLRPVTFPTILFTYYIKKILECMVT
jgi:hypothetical protein